MKGGDLNALWAGVFLDELARSGVQEICVAPGSRSTPLVLAAASDPRFRVTSVVDERSAGFLALGMGKASGVPAAVITTSGTAGANLYPAVIEASQGEVPLLVLTADRPHRLRDTDGNQAMDQLRLFGAFPRMFTEVALPRLSEGDLKHLRALACRAVALAQGPAPGPVPLTFPFEKPLEPSDPGQPSRSPPEGVSQLAWAGREGGEPFVRVPSSRWELSGGEETRLQEALSGASRGLIVAGPHPGAREVGPALLALSAATGFPILADPLSGARFSPPRGAQVVSGYDLFLRAPSVRKALAPDLILRVGASPTSAPLLQYLGEHSATLQIVVDDGHRWKDHLASAHSYFRADPASLLGRIAAAAPLRGGEGWRALWDKAESRVLEQLNRVPEGAFLEGEILARVVEALPEGANLLVGNSMPIRELDAFAHPRSKQLNIFGNRGTSGIDGLVSTTQGIGAVSPGVTVGVLGDLTFFHDMNGLLTLKKEKFPVGFVVVNNDGGGIFHTLPVRSHEPEFTRFFATPHGLDFEQVARLYELPFGRVEDGEELTRALKGFLEEGGPFILEARSARAEGHEERKKLIEAMVTAFEEDQLV